MLGTLYVLCFTPAYKHAKHYVGWTSDLAARGERHLRGHGANLVAVATAAGCAVELTLEIPNVTRAFERSLKRCGSAKRYCPACAAKPYRLTRARARDLARCHELGLLPAAPLEATA